MGRVPVLLAISPCASGGTWHRVIQPIFCTKTKIKTACTSPQLKAVGVGVGRAVSASDEDVRGLPGEKCRPADKFPRVGAPVGKAPSMGGQLDDLSDKWFTLAGPDATGQIPLSLGLRAQARLETAGGVEEPTPDETVQVLKPGSFMARQAFVAAVDGIVSSKGGDQAKVRTCECIRGHAGIRLSIHLSSDARVLVQALVHTLHERMHPCKARSCFLHAQVVAELEGMVSDIERFGPPPAETGDEIKDMNAYRQYHGLDKALAYLLQTLVVEEPAECVKALIDKLEGMPRLAELRSKFPDGSYAEAFAQKPL